MPTTTTPVGGISSFRDITPTSDDSAGSTITADAVDNTGATGTSAGSIAGGVIGGLLGLAVLAFIVAFILRRTRQRRRRALRHESDFGTFNRSAFVTEKNPPTVPDMSEASGHGSSPSVSTVGGAGMAGYGAASGGATLPSQALAAANAASAAAVLQERPKYVYGQDPNAAADSQHDQDDAASEAHGGAYSSQPQAQTGYDAEAYGSYAQYAEGGQAEGAYQDAQREYQGQQGYEAQQGYDGQQAYYDQNAYAGYDQQQQGGFYDQNAYVQGYDQQAYAQGYDQTQYDYSQQQPQQEAYQAPHPYAGGATSTAY